jgi:hypothetical protein
MKLYPIVQDIHSLYQNNQIYFLAHIRTRQVLTLEQLIIPQLLAQLCYSPALKE